MAKGTSWRRSKNTDGMPFEVRLGYGLRHHATTRRYRVELQTSYDEMSDVTADSAVLELVFSPAARGVTIAFLLRVRLWLRR